MMRVRTVIGGGITSGPGLHTAYWQSASEDDAAAGVITNSMIAFWEAIKGRITGGGTLTVQGAVDVIDPATGELTDVLTGNSGVTTANGGTELLPRQAQGGIALFTPGIVAGHRVHGRWNIPGPNETENTAGAPVAGYIAALNAAVAALVGPGGAATQIVVWSRPAPTAIPPRAGSMHPVTSAVTRSFWYTLNSRRD